MADPSGEGKMIVPPPPSNKRMRQHDEIGPLVWSAIFSPILLLTVNFRQPSHEFTFGVGMNFVSYPMVLTPLV
jgi:hypothetical protein